jgi:hypothetical protein
MMFRNLIRLPLVYIVVPDFKPFIISDLYRDGSCIALITVAKWRFTHSLWNYCKNKIHNLQFIPIFRYKRNLLQQFSYRLWLMVVHWYSPIQTKFATAVLLQTLIDGTVHSLEYSPGQTRFTTAVLLQTLIDGTIHSLEYSPGQTRFATVVLLQTLIDGTVHWYSPGQTRFATVVLLQTLMERFTHSSILRRKRDLLQ